MPIQDTHASNPSASATRSPTPPAAETPCVGRPQSKSNKPFPTMVLRDTPRAALPWPSGRPHECTPYRKRYLDGCRDRHYQTSTPEKWKISVTANLVTQGKAHTGFGVRSRRSRFWSVFHLAILSHTGQGGLFHAQQGVLQLTRL